MALIKWEPFSDMDNVRAEYKSGELTITLPKVGKEKPSKIMVEEKE